VTFDASRIHQGLFQGSRPPTGARLQREGFRLLVLCAMEHQPPASAFPGVTVIHAPNDDDFDRMPTREELQLALGAARQAALVLASGGLVLSTCFAGRNRSGLVSALSLHLWLGVSGNKAIEMIQARRQRALRNPGFLTVLGRLSAQEKLCPSNESLTGT